MANQIIKLTENKREQFACKLADDKGFANCPVIGNIDCEDCRNFKEVK